MSDEIFGIDYSAKGELTSTGDLMLVKELDNARQAIRNRLLTRIGVYDYLPKYGCKLDEIQGSSRNQNALQLLELIIRDALNREPRVQEVLELHCYFDDKAVIAEINLLLVSNNVLDLDIILEEE